MSHENSLARAQMAVWLYLTEGKMHAWLEKFPKDDQKTLRDLMEGIYLRGLAQGIQMKGDLK